MENIFLAIFLPDTVEDGLEDHQEVTIGIAMVLIRTVEEVLSQEELILTFPVVLVDLKSLEELIRTCQEAHVIGQDQDLVQDHPLDFKGGREVIQTYVLCRY